MDRAGVKDLIGYDSLTQAAKRYIVAEALARVAKTGALPGDHHFYITFRTRTPGVVMADHLKDRFPEEMTIVVQHQFWELEVYDDRFELILQFSGVPQHIAVPFLAVTRFHDPSVEFGLQFEREAAAGDAPRATIRPPEAAQPQRPAAGGLAARALPDHAAAPTVVSLDAFRRGK